MQELPFVKLFFQKKWNFLSAHRAECGTRRAAASGSSGSTEGESTGRTDYNTMSRISFTVGRAFARAVFLPDAFVFCFCRDAGKIRSPDEEMQSASFKSKINSSTLSGVTAAASSLSGRVRAG